MDLLQFTDPTLFKSISLDQETLMLVSKDSNYTFHINFKDEIKGVDFYELALATKSSSGYINKSGTASVIQKYVLEILNGNNTNQNDNKKDKISNKSGNNKKFYQNIKR